MSTLKIVTGPHMFANGDVGITVCFNSKHSTPWEVSVESLKACLGSQLEVEVLENILLQFYGKGIGWMVELIGQCDAIKESK